MTGYDRWKTTEPDTGFYCEGCGKDECTCVEDEDFFYDCMRIAQWWILFPLSWKIIGIAHLFQLHGIALEHPEVLASDVKELSWMKPTNT